jgi:hypothetical protein
MNGLEDFTKANKMLEDIPVIFGNCTSATTPAPILAKTCNGNVEWVYPQEKGNNPMRTTYESTTANAVITAAKSDEAIQREYLINRLDASACSWRNPKYAELREFFHLDDDSTPKTAKELIDAIKSDKFTLDEKKLKRLEQDSEDLDDDDDDFDSRFYGPFYGIIFEGPKPDRKGYDKAIKEYSKAREDARDTIMIGTPAEGLAALKALEDWKPEGLAN